jgi:hypothetical protein
MMLKQKNTEDLFTQSGEELSIEVIEEATIKALESLPNHNCFKSVLPQFTMRFLGLKYPGVPETSTAHGLVDALRMPRFMDAIENLQIAGIIIDHDVNGGLCLSSGYKKLMSNRIKEKKTGFNYSTDRNPDDAYIRQLNRRNKSSGQTRSGVGEATLQKMGLLKQEASDISTIVSGNRNYESRSGQPLLDPNKLEAVTDDLEKLITDSAEPGLPPLEKEVEISDTDVTLETSQDIKMENPQNVNGSDKRQSALGPLELDECDIVSEDRYVTDIKRGAQTDVLIEIEKLLKYEPGLAVRRTLGVVCIRYSGHEVTVEGEISRLQPSNSLRIQIALPFIQTATLALLELLSQDSVLSSLRLGKSPKGLAFILRHDFPNPEPSQVFYEVLQIYREVDQALQLLARFK